MRAIGTAPSTLLPITETAADISDLFQDEKAPGKAWRRTGTSPVGGPAGPTSSDELQEEADDANSFDEQSRWGTLQRRVPDILPDVELDAFIASPLAAALEVGFRIA